MYFPLNCNIDINSYNRNPGRIGSMFAESVYQPVNTPSDTASDLDSENIDIPSAVGTPSDNSNHNFYSGEEIRNTIYRIDSLKADWNKYSHVLKLPRESLEKQQYIDMLDYTHYKASELRLKLLDIVQINGNRTALAAVKKLIELDGSSNEDWDLYRNSLLRYADLCEETFNDFKNIYSKYHSLAASLPGSEHSMHKAFDKFMEHQEIIKQICDERGIPHGIIEGIILNEVTDFDFFDSMDITRLDVCSYTPVLSAIPRLNDASLGICQVFVSTAEKMELAGYMPKSDSHEEVIEKLLKDSINIGYCASILQWYAGTVGYDPCNLKALEYDKLKDIASAYNRHPGYGDEIMDYRDIINNFYEKVPLAFDPDMARIPYGLNYPQQIYYSQYFKSKSRIFR